jgi:hypothetical protein
MENKMATGTRRWAAGTEAGESYETAIPVRPEPASVTPEAHAPAGKRATKFVKTIHSDVAEGFKMQEDRGSGVILFKFEQNPHPDVQKILNDHDFKWSVVKAAWARPISYEGRVAADKVIEALRTNEPGRIPG